MKKLLLGAAFMLGAITVNAQDGPKVGQEDLSLYPNVEEYGIYPCGDGIPPWVIKVMERLVQTLVEWLLLPMEQKC